MIDRGRYWRGRRVLVLGCTGFLGGWAVRRLLARRAEVVGLVRGINPASEFVRDKLYRHVHVARGRADDVQRLRTLICVYEAQLVVQCAADPDGSAESYTRVAVAAAGSVPVVVPLCHGIAVRPRPASDTPTDVTLVRLPTLFGGGDRRWDRWPPRLLLAAAHGEPLPPPPAEQVGVPVLAVGVAIDGMLDGVTDPPASETPRNGFRTTEVLPGGTAADLYAAAARLSASGPRLHQSPDHAEFHTDGRRLLAESVAEAIDWYRTAVPPGVRPGVLPPPPKAAA